MLSLFHNFSLNGSENKPAIALVRTFKRSEQGPKKHYSNLNERYVFMKAAKSTQETFGVSCSISAADFQIPELWFSVESGKSSIVVNGDNCSPIDLFQDTFPSELFEKEPELILYFGLQLPGQKTSVNRNACIHFIRKIRVERPIVYAQLLSWSSPRVPISAPRDNIMAGMEVVV